MLHAQIALIPDIYADSRVPHDAYRPIFVKSLVAAGVALTNMKLNAESSGRG
jgi:hypothetical protein